MGRHDQKTEGDEERQAAELRTNPPAEHQKDTADHAGHEAEFGEPDSSVSLDGERKECHAINDLICAAGRDPIGPAPKPAPPRAA
jgi:hypothetical protein